MAIEIIMTAVQMGVSCRVRNLTEPTVKHVMTATEWMETVAHHNANRNDSTNAVCGDGQVDAPECDDANTVTENCAYGVAGCTVCRADCQSARSNLILVMVALMVRLNSVMMQILTPRSVHMVS